MANIKMLLEEAGSKLEHICKITIYIIDPRYREPVYRTVGQPAEGVYPVSTGIVVSGLARPEWLVEIDATAVIPDTAQAVAPDNRMTFSIAARCPATGMFGLAISLPPRRRWRRAAPMPAPASGRWRRRTSPILPSGRSAST